MITKHIFEPDESGLCAFVVESDGESRGHVSHNHCQAAAA